MNIYIEQSDPSQRGKEDLGVAIIFSILSSMWLMIAGVENLSSSYLYWLIALAWIGATLTFFYRSRKNFSVVDSCMKCKRTHEQAKPFVEGLTKSLICGDCLVRLSALPMERPTKLKTIQPSREDKNPYSAPTLSSELNCCSFCGLDQQLTVQVSNSNSLAICDQCLEISLRLVEQQ